MARCRPSGKESGPGQAELVICDQPIDITYIPTRQGWLYLAVVEDLFSRMIVGWAMDGTMTSRLVVDALGMAVRRGADRGSRADARRENHWHDEGSGWEDGMAGSVRGEGRVVTPSS